MQTIKRLILTGGAALFCAGCVSVQTNASYTPVVDEFGNALVIRSADGQIVGIAASKTMSQRVIATAGGKVSEALQQFKAEFRADEGWVIESGTDTVDVDTPEIPVETFIP